MNAKSSPVIRELLRAGVCQLCNQKTMNLEVDHDHTTERVRGVVCPECNRYVIKAAEVRPDLVSLRARLYINNPPLEGHDIMYKNSGKSAPIWKDEDLHKITKLAAKGQKDA